MDRHTPSHARDGTRRSTSTSVSTARNTYGGTGMVQRVVQVLIQLGALAFGALCALIWLHHREALQARLRQEDNEPGETGAVIPQPSVQRVNLDQSWMFRGTVALKSEKIIYCPIQKVACTEWLKVFRWIDGQDDWEQPRHKKHGLTNLNAIPLDKANEMLNSPEWLKIAVVRDPLERLLSCFMQKCVKWNMKNEYGNCPYLQLWPDVFKGVSFPGGSPRSPNDDALDVVMAEFEARGRDEMFRQYVLAITRRVKESPCRQNPHWAPQWCHCTLDRTAPVYTMVGWGNMTAAAKAAIVPAASSTTRGQQIATFIDHRMGSNHERDGKKTSAHYVVNQKYSEVMIQEMHEAYERDYAMFSQVWAP